MKTKTILQTVLEMPEFIRQSESCMDDESRKTFIDYIAEHPLTGDLIVGTGGVRKIRWTGDSHQGKHGKNKKDNLTQDEKHILKTIIGKIVDAYKENEHE